MKKSRINYQIIIRSIKKLLPEKGETRTVIVNLNTLPIEIYNKIPISLKTYKSEYEYSDLPFDIQNLIKKYIVKDVDYNDKKIYDFQLYISEYGDLKTVENLIENLKSYIQNYFTVTKGNYPFNGLIGSNMKTYLQKKDTTLQNLYITEEIGNMIREFTNDNTDLDIRLVSFNINKSLKLNMVEYVVSIVLKINSVQQDISISFIS